MLVNMYILGLRFYFLKLFIYRDNSLRLPNNEIDHMSPIDLYLFDAITLFFLYWYFAIQFINEDNQISFLIRNREWEERERERERERETERERESDRERERESCKHPQRNDYKIINHHHNNNVWNNNL